MSGNDFAVHTNDRHHELHCGKTPHGVQGAVAERASSGGASRAAPGAGPAAVTLRASQAASRQKGTCENAARAARPPARSVTRIAAARALPASAGASSPACAAWIRFRCWVFRPLAQELAWHGCMYCCMWCFAV